MRHAAKLGLALLFSVMLGGPATAQADDTAAALRPVKVMSVSAGDGGTTRHFFGQVVARETVDLAFQVSGQIVEFPIIEGETVAEGAIVAQLELEVFERALEQARLTKDQADAKVARMQKLGGDTVSQVAIDDAVTEAGLADVAYRSAKYNLEKATLYAPFDALVASRNVANFSTINAGTPVARLHDMSELRIEIDVPEILFQRAGGDAQVTLNARFPTSEERFPLEIREYNAEASQVGQTYRLTLAMPRPDGMNLLPGASVTVEATIQTGRNVMEIPASALVIAADGTASVMVFEPGAGDTGTLRRTPVEVEPTLNGGFVVVSGLDPGDEIVAAGAAVLEDAQTVRRFTGFSS